MNKKMRLGVLVSGGGTNLQALIDAQNQKDAPYTIAAVFSDRSDAFAIERAKGAHIPVLLVSPSAVMGADSARMAAKAQKRIAQSDYILHSARELQLDALVLAGYLSILAGRLLEVYANRIINLHPALLPKFGGEGMWGHHVHEAVLAAGETESGCTVHLVDAGCDTGRILLQKKLPVLSDDTPDSLAKRIHALEHQAIVEGVYVLANEAKIAER